MQHDQNDIARQGHRARKSSDNADTRAESVKEVNLVFLRLNDCRKQSASLVSLLKLDANRLSTYQLVQ